ncbi:MAG: GGDEF domain-containing protein [Thiobacillus sp.]|nr:GGDEF domain-containing protein [Thiobacillus sp.]
MLTYSAPGRRYPPYLLPDDNRLTTDPTVAPPDDASFVQLRDLQLDDACALLKHDAQHIQPQAGESHTAYLQRLINGLCELSLTDPLTGLGNRRHFHSVLERSIDVVARSGESVLLLLLDIDHFKTINDTHGHLAGDQVLREIGTCLARCLRPMDTVARYGGEEFAIILPSCRPAFGLAVAERIRQSIAALEITVAHMQTLRVTISIGGAYAPEWVRSTTALWIERADTQLYRAKSEGRNRVCLDQPQELAVTAEEKGLLFGHLMLDDSGALHAPSGETSRDASDHPAKRGNV